jgi:hypothetical protein
MAEHTIVEETRTFLKKQREILIKERQGIFAEQQALQERLDAVNETLAKFDVFEGNPSRQSGPRRTRQGRRSSRRDGIIAELADIPHGLSRGEILDKLGLKATSRARCPSPTPLRLLQRPTKSSARMASMLCLDEHGSST